MTEKLYYTDSHIKTFTARVLTCEERNGTFAATLDQTAFFPEGGGQSADTGFIGPARVLDVHERDGQIVHTLDRAIPAGEEYACGLDWEQRLRRMQNHSGEHIVSGLVHREYGFENVGFHMGEDCMTIDFSGELTWEQLLAIEKLANETVRANVPIRAWFPDSETLKTMEYRSKLELTHDIRIVEIEGIDRCACCAPHVERTGEVGLIKVLDCMRHRGGVRVSLVCGMDALDVMNVYQQGVTAVSGTLSAKRHEIASAVERMKSEQQRARERGDLLGLELVKYMAAGYPDTDGNIVLFNSILDEVSLRELVNLLMDKCRLAAVFFGEEGAYRYIIGSKKIDLRANAKAINTAISGRGGGKNTMITGSCTAARKQIESAIQNF